VNARESKGGGGGAKQCTALIEAVCSISLECERDDRPYPRQTPSDSALTHFTTAHSMATSSRLGPSYLPFTFTTQLRRLLQQIDCWLPLGERCWTHLLLYNRSVECA